MDAASIRLEIRRQTWDPELKCWILWEISFFSVGAGVWAMHLNQIRDFLSSRNICDA